MKIECPNCGEIISQNVPDNGITTENGPEVGGRLCQTPDCKNIFFVSQVGPEICPDCQEKKG